MDNIELKILTLWQEQNWKSLMQYAYTNLECQNNRAFLTLICAYACHNRSDTKQAKILIDRALSWGAERNFIVELFLSDIDKHLADVFKLLDFNKYDSVKNNYIVSDPLSQSKDSGKHPVNNKSTLKVRKIASIELGEGWASNTVNTVIFRQHAILTIDTFQITAFYINNQKLRVCKRCLKTNELDFFDIEGNYNLLDAHNSISLGLDRENFLHICYDHHGSALRYRRSNNKLDIASWSPELKMSGKKEDQMTYPTFVLPRRGLPLLILYRDGYWKRGKAYIKYFDESLNVWEDYPLPILSGADNAPWTSNAYWNNPVVDNCGVLHLSYCWRTDYVNEDKVLNNVNVDYARSYNGGYDWTTIKGQRIKLPITQVNSDTALAVAPGSNLMNQNSMAVDSLGNPHITFYSNDRCDIPQYKHLWFDGFEWHCNVVSESQLNFNLSGAGTLKLPFSRPDIILDENDNVYIIYRSLNTNNNFVITQLLAPDYKFHTSSTEILLDYDVAQAEPIIDKTRWSKEKILSLFLQKNLQPDGDVETQSNIEKVFIVDFEILNIFGKQGKNNEYS